MINQILNRELYENEVFNYFKQKKYFRKLITSDTVKGDYFEEAVNYGLYNFLPNKSDYALEVKEIITMEKIGRNSLDSDYLEDESEEDEEMEIAEEKGIDNLDKGISTQEKFIEMDVEISNSDNNELIDLDTLLNRFSNHNNNDNTNNKSDQRMDNLEIIE